MKVNGSGWKFALIFMAGIVIAAQLLFIIHWRWRYWQGRHWQAKLPSSWVAIDVLQQPIAQQAANLSSVRGPAGGSGMVYVKGLTQKRNGQIVQELVCPRNQKQLQQLHGCYAIVDRKSERGFVRALTMEPMAQLVITEAQLNFPAHYNFTRENARQWQVIGTKVSLDYQKVLVSQPFLTQTFAPSMTPDKVPDGKTRRVLCLGLRGSSVNNFFANLSTKYDVTVVEPESALKYIAKKWFALEESGHHRVLSENPVFYLTARAHQMAHPNASLEESLREKSAPFHFIALDLCYGFGAEAPGKCPMEEYSDEIVVSALAKNLAENGTISVNFFSLTSKMDVPAQHQLANNEHRWLQLYKKYFGNCFFVNIGANLILTCTRNGPMTRLKYHMGSRKLPLELQQFTTKEEPKFFLDLEALK